MPGIPPQLISSLQNVSGFDETSFLEAHEYPVQVTSIRLNPDKSFAADDHFQAALSAADGLSTTSNGQPVSASEPGPPTSTIVPWCPEGRYLSHRPSFTLDPSFHAGAYYVQEASSMFIDHIIRNIYTGDIRPETVLDLCAAPGGKSTLLAAFFNNSLVVSNEVIRQRVTVLAENVSKWGSSNVLVTHSDPKEFKRLPGFFDLMVVDAPCSGSGLFRKDPDAIEEWSERNVQMCSMRQERILSDALPALKKNGYLIYSTCSYSKEEDEDICDLVVETFGLVPVAIPCPESWGIVETASQKYKVPAYRFYPYKLQGEGFFVACFQRVDEAEHHHIYSAELKSVVKTGKNLLEQWISMPASYVFFRQGEIIIAFLKKYEGELQALLGALNVRKSGVATGTVKGTDFIPHHELALSGLLLPTIPSINLDKENALRYLRRKELKIELPPKGWMLARYKGLNLGWIKVLPNRINNYYPIDWRILKE